MRDSIDFKTMNIPKLFRKLLIPTVLGMIFNAIFIITDGIFVGKGIGSDALAAVNITAPLFLINTGVALMFGIGASVVASVHLSQGKAKVARINVTQAIIVSSVLLLIYAIGIVSNVERVAVWQVLNVYCLWLWSICTGLFLFWSLVLYSVLVCFLSVWMGHLIMQWCVISFLL